MLERRQEGGERMGGRHPIVWTIESIDKKNTENKIHVGLRWLLMKKFILINQPKTCRNDVGGNG
jgi:hypothetical protein